MAATRGVRNNNPGNIDRSSANKWQGRMPVENMTTAQRHEGRFEVFSSPAWGIRAMCVLLINYYDRHGCDTVRKVIDRWAPPVENNTDAYVAAVAKAIGVGPDSTINLHEYRRMRPLVEAIISHENAGYRYASETVEEGLRLAGLVKPDAAPLVAVPKAATTAAVTAATTGGAVALAEVVQQALPAVQTLMPAVQQANAIAQSTSALPSWLRLVVAVAVLVTAGASIYTWWRLRRAHRAVAP
ncbi:hypothetical protein ABW43_00135 [Stenotrophomonas maltophilia]|nr:hypothetical protein ABW43_00135 [Stenotrophomonas maltophilia]